MKRTKNNAKAMALIIAMGMVSACTQPGGFGSAFDRDGANGAGSGAGGVVAGSASDPQSPAYFNQTIGDRIFFAVDQSTLSDEARGVLAQQAQWLAKNPSYAAVIEGHADEQGTREYNFALSSRRAAAVQTFLISQGVEPQRIKTIPFGKERPVAVCSSESCYAQNRRGVTIVSSDAFSSANL